ncbi:MAG: hypothetical protein IJ803_02135 [Oribacterium sp.]|nr:hypothetical protein [Oribacterium sp.]
MMTGNTLKTEFLYARWDGFSNSLRYSVRLYDEIDYEVLKKAVQTAKDRYPYLNLKVVMGENGPEIVENDAPVPVTYGEKPVVLGGSEAFGHFWAVACEGNDIFFDIYHNLTDAKGIINAIKTVLYLYLSEHTGDSLSDEGICLPGQDFLPGELDDPYEAAGISDDMRPIYELKQRGALAPDFRYATDMERCNYAIKASVDDVMKIARQCDASPAVILAYYLKETIRELFPDMEGQPISCGFPHSVRDIASGENNYHNQTVDFHVFYDDRINALPMKTQLICTRGAIVLQGDPDNVRYQMSQRVQFAKKVSEFPTYAEKKKAYRDNIKVLIANKETIVVSYLGITDWGSIEKYISEVRLHCSPLLSPIFIGACCVNNDLNISLMINHTSDAYAKKFVELMNGDGISAELLHAFPNDVSEVEMCF